MSNEFIIWYDFCSEKHTKEKEYMYRNNEKRRERHNPNNSNPSYLKATNRKWHNVPVNHMGEPAKNIKSCCINDATAHIENLGAQAKQRSE